MLKNVATRSILRSGLRQPASPTLALLIASMAFCGCSSQSGGETVRTPDVQSSTQSSPAPSAIRGVVQFEDGSPLPYGNVIITGTSLGSVTHQDGSFAIVGLPAGSARLRVTALGYRGEKIELLTLVAGKTTKVTIVVNSKDLVRLEGVISESHSGGSAKGVIGGVVRDSRTKQPVTYANVLVVGTTLGAMSLQEGEFTIVGVPAGVHRVKGMMMGYRAVTIDSVVVRSGEETWLSIAMASSGPSFSDSAVAERSVVGSETRATAGDIQVEIHPDKNPFRVGDRPIFRVVLRNVGREAFYLVGAIDDSEYKARYPHVTLTIDGPEGGISRTSVLPCGYVNALETGDFVELQSGEEFEPITSPFWAPTDAQYAEFAKPGRFVAKFHYSSDAIDYVKWDGQLKTWPTPESVISLLKRVPRLVVEDSLEVTVVE